MSFFYSTENERKFIFILTRVASSLIGYLDYRCNVHYRQRAESEFAEAFKKVEGDKNEEAS